jgi:hypothetical protein
VIPLLGGNCNHKNRHFKVKKVRKVTSLEENSEVSNFERTSRDNKGILLVGQEKRKLSSSKSRTASHHIKILH